MEIIDTQDNCDPGNSVHEAKLSVSNFNGMVYGKFICYISSHKEQTGKA